MIGRLPKGHCNRRDPEKFPLGQLAETGTMPAQKPEEPPEGTTPGPALQGLSPRALLSVAAARGHPLTPFVVGDGESGNEDEAEDDEEPVH